ncbi:hypothetical protein IHE44_0009752 [Lamprotornis superbus]|uniref:Uncharacterized protein n=1 Tax=Lamprotornis superbus TaxID=245042 RepID=A0A835U195_9PASS|nr:hypothetical protein IHE44_0009752 [Lamprotornis superbus]
MLAYERKIYLLDIAHDLVGGQLFQVPYSALTMFLSTDQRDRDSATAYRMTMEVLGTLIGAALQGQIVASAHVSPHCTVTPSENTTASWHDTPTIPDPSDPLSHQVSAVVSVPFWQKFLQRFGKKCAACGISWMIPFAVMLVTIPNLILAYFVAFVSGVEPFELDSFMFTGYKPGICRQSDDVILTLKLLIGAVPAILILLGLFILLFYPITEESRKETKLALEELRDFEFLDKPRYEYSSSPHKLDCEGKDSVSTLAGTSKATPAFKPQILSRGSSVATATCKFCVASTAQM